MRFRSVYASRLGQAQAHSPNEFSLTNFVILSFDCVLSVVIIVFLCSSLWPCVCVCGVFAGDGDVFSCIISVLAVHLLTAPPPSPSANFGAFRRSSFKKPKDLGNKLEWGGGGAQWSPVAGEGADKKQGARHGDRLPAGG